MRLSPFVFYRENIFYKSFVFPKVLMVSQGAHRLYGRSLLSTLLSTFVITFGKPP